MAYVFDPEVLHEIAKLGVGQAPDRMFPVILSALKERYPQQVKPTGRWYFNNAGGAMGQLQLLHASLSEYLIFFGSPIGTEGHSGRYVTEVYDFMIQGTMWCFHEGDTQKTIFGPGDKAYLGRNQTKGYRLPEGAFMLEYARGPIVTMLPFGFMDVFSSTLDARAFLGTFKDYACMTVGSLLRGKI